MVRPAATSALVMPRAIRRSTSTSRAVSPSRICGVNAGRAPSRMNSVSMRRVTAGASIASPAATARTASASVVADASLSRNPLAPARNARNTYSSRSNVVSTMNPGVWRGRATIRAVASSPVAHGHAHVHQNNIGLGPVRDLDGRCPIGYRTDDLDTGLRTQQHDYPLPHQRLIVRDEHPDRHGGTCRTARTRYPPSLVRPVSSRRDAAPPAPACRAVRVRRRVRQNRRGRHC